MADTVLLAAAQDLLSCLCAQLALNPDPPQNCCLRAGQLVIADIDGASGTDKVCCPGTAYVRIGAVFPSSEFPAVDALPNKRGGCFPVAWAAELTMGVVRCIPGMGTLEGPTCADWTLAATHDANDQDAMRRALCCWSETLSRTTLTLIQPSAVEMQADCIERTMPVLLSLPRCC